MCIVHAAFLVQALDSRWGALRRHASTRHEKSLVCQDSTEEGIGMCYYVCSICLTLVPLTISAAARRPHAFA